MKHATHNLRRALILASTTLLVTGCALAEPDWRRNSDRDGRVERRDIDVHHSGYRQGYGEAQQRHFQDHHRIIVRDYYVQEFQGRHCPPGLAKRHNGCVPPGHARQWRLGYPLAPQVVYYEVPQPLVLQIGAPPRGHRYVRVAGDILMIALGTGLVVDAIEDMAQYR